MKLKEYLDKVSSSIPAITAMLIFAAGLINILSAIFVYSQRRMEILDQFIPLEVRHTSRTFTLLAGFFLLYLAWGLWQRKYRAWFLSILLLLVSFFLHLTKGLDFEESIVVLIPLSLLILFRNLFVVQSGRSELISRIKTTFVILFFLFLYSFFGFYLFQGQFSHQINAQNIVSEYTYTITGIGEDTLIPKTRFAKRFEDSIFLFGFTTLLLSLGILFVPLIIKYKPSEEERNHVHDLLSKYQGHSLSYFDLMDDKQYFFSNSMNSVIAYKIANNTSVALGDPIGDAKEISICIESFLKAMKIQGLPVIFYNVPEESLDIYKELGLQSFKIGEEAYIDTNNFSLEGADIAEIRHCVNRMKRELVSYVWYNCMEMPWHVINEVDDLYQEWTRSRKMASLTFSLDFYPFPVANDAKVLNVYSSANTLLATFSFLPYKMGKAMALDLMLRSKEAVNGTVEAAIAESILYLRSQGVEEISLGVAPLSNTDEEDDSIVSKTIQYIFKNVNTFYSFQSLFTFKKKFLPKWGGKYMVYQNNAVLPKVTVAALRAHMKQNMLVSFFKR